MGRLENFIPQVSKFRVQGRGEIRQVDFDGKQALPIEAATVPFLKQLNGHMSLREVFMFLTGQGQPVNFEKSLSLLDHLANTGRLLNAEDYFQILREGGNGQNQPGEKHDKKYFTEERLVGLIQKTTLFLQCDRKVAEKILKASKLRAVKPEERLIHQGTTSPTFFVLLSGEVGVYRGGDCLAYLEPLAVFGESAAIFNKERNADVYATDDCWVLEIDATQLIDTSSKDSFEKFKGLKSRLILNQTLAANPLFRGLPTDVLQCFISQCRIEKYGREQEVITQGETSGDFYFILQGSVAVIRDAIPVTSLTEGEYFGEIAAVLNQPRTASILCETACTFLVLNQKALFEVLSSHFRLAVSIERMATKRLESKTNILHLFEESFGDSDDMTSEIPLNQDLNSVAELEIDPEFLEISQTNFDLEIFDFSTTGTGKAS